MVRSRLGISGLSVDPAPEDDYDQIIWNVRFDGTVDASLAIPASR
ncbi:hypothetical protein [Mesorhizobium sp. M0830]